MSSNRERSSRFFFESCALQEKICGCKLTGNQEKKKNNKKEKKKRRKKRRKENRKNREKLKCYMLVSFTQ